MCSIYQLKLEVVPPAGGVISAITAFGDPKFSTSYPQQAVTYKLQPPPVIGTTTVQFAKPSLMNGTGNQAGAPEWNPTNGFIPQNLATPSSNFPTTGFNGAFFDVKLSTAMADKVYGLKDAGGHEAVSITVEPITSDEVRVLLVGPTDGSPPVSAHSATTFRLKLGLNGSDIYTFEIGKWFIAKPSVSGVGLQWNSSGQVGFPPAGTTTGYEVPRYCAGLGGSAGDYNVPSIVDYTNGNGNGNGWSGGLVGQGDSYKRAIGSGLFTEWGWVNNSYYTTSDFEPYYYWVNELYNSGNMYNVGPTLGNIAYAPPTYINRMTACVSP